MQIKTNVGEILCTYIEETNMHKMLCSYNNIIIILCVQNKYTGQRWKQITYNIYVIITMFGT